MVSGSLQWGRDLSIAESYSATTKASTRSQCFNGAAIFRSRKGVPIDLLLLYFYHASMGPRSFDRGKHCLLAWSSAKMSCFNGAAIFRSRKAWL